MNYVLSETPATALDVEAFVESCLAVIEGQYLDYFVGVSSSIPELDLDNVEFCTLHGTGHWRQEVSSRVLGEA